MNPVLLVPKIKIFETAIRLNPNFADAYYYLGLLSSQIVKLYGEKAISKAIVNYNKAIQLNPNFAEAYFERARVRSKNPDNILVAIKDYSKAIQLKSDFAEAYYHRGLLHSQLVVRQEELKQKAIKDYIQALSLNPSAYAANQKTAENHIKVLQINPKDTNDYYERGRVLYQLGDYKGAIEDYTHALKLNPNLANAFIKRGKTYCQMHKSDTDYTIVRHAISDFTKAIQLNSKNAEAYYERGRACTTGGFYGYTLEFYKELSKEEVITDLTKAIQLNPNYVKAYYQRSLAQYNPACRGYEPEAAEAVEDIIQFIKIVGGWGFKGSYDEELVGSDWIIEDYHEVLDVNPQDISAMYRRGMDNLKQGEKSASN